MSSLALQPLSPAGTPPLADVERTRRLLLATEPDLPSAALHRMLDPDAGPPLPFNDAGLKAAGIPDASRRRLLEASPDPQTRVQELEDRCRRLGIAFAVRGEPGYPERLARCADAPPVLFWKGRAPMAMGAARPRLAVVGTRRASAYGVSGAARLIRELAHVQPVLISGGAYGIDAAAHRAALDVGLPTWVVLAGGVDRPYPTAHGRLFAAILEAGGCLIGECPPGIEALKHRFPRRNRLIAGLSDAVLVVESAAKGGSLITADQAFSYHREVLAYPGPVGHPQQVGTHALIRREMARLVTSGADICRVLHWSMPGASASQTDCPPRYVALRTALLAAGGLDARELAVRLGKDPADAGMLLLEAELEGLVEARSAGRYRWR